MAQCRGHCVPTCVRSGNFQNDQIVYDDFEVVLVYVGLKHDVDEAGRYRIIIRSTLGNCNLLFNDFFNELSVCFKTINGSPIYICVRSITNH